jgi:hypothetical protein
MRRIAGVIFAAMLALLSGNSDAGVIYVNNITGSDRANGFRENPGAPGDGPLATITRALQLASGTDLISIANTSVPYEESVTVDRPELSGSERFPFIVEGNGAVMRGAKRLPADAWRRVGQEFYRYQPYRKGHYQLVVNGTVAEEAATPSGEPTASALSPLQWYARRGFVYLRLEPQTFVDQYEIQAPLFDIGFGVHNVRNVVVRNLVIELYRLDGVAVTGNSQNIRLVDIRSTANGRAGLSVSGTSEVQVAGLDLNGNREADELELVKGRIIPLPRTVVPPKPDLDPSR